MKYEEIFERDITSYSDEEIISNAMKLRAACKLSKAKPASKTARTKTNASPTKTKTELMLEEALAKAGAKK